MLRRRCLKLSFVIVFSMTTGFSLFLHRLEISEETAPLPLEHYCKNLHDKFLAMKQLKSAQNATKFFMEQLLHRTDLRSSCNASGKLFLTRNNTKLGQRITYEVDRKAFKLVDKMVYDMLPETHPWGTSRGLGRCAVVGNGGTLRNSKCGAEINSADFVIRHNLAPMNYSSDVGVKTNLVTVNPSQITESFQGLCHARRPFVEKAASHGDAHLAIAAFSYGPNTEISFRIFYTMRDMRPQQGVLYFHPDYLMTLDRYWRKKGLKCIRLSSGFMLMSAALELCEKVDLYGFWPFALDLFEKSLPNHYYDNIPAKRGVHTMPEEFMLLLEMHSQGVLQLHIGECQTPS
ncbi:hypothetical protein AGOR_G00075770 [Albula goreensis]|uniref:Uncharacterized protein n=1 Tax=Albula goreensis TaxID=1534307 RepID=A0A8T3DVP9_9TELE|nr:hypothetical protein AGOR_G00075770 [Albula goreensis]